MSENIEEQNTEEMQTPVEPTKTYSSVSGTPEVAARLANLRDMHRRQAWYDSTTIWGYNEEAQVSTWAGELMCKLNAHIEDAGFLFDRDHLSMTKRLLYWCWEIQRRSPGTPTDEIPFPNVSKENSNLPEDFNVFFKTLGQRYWIDLEEFWRPDWMIDGHATYFFAALEQFCWNHINTEDSPTIQKERELQAAAYDDGSGDEGRGGGDQGSYFKGKKEFY